MPNIKSAKKRVRQSEKRASRTKHMITKIKSEMKRVQKMESNKTEQVGPLHSLIDRAEKADLMHKNKANRLKGRVSRLAVK